jgi:3-(3-hydroxy-phenyl)propionate hydroxylase
VRQDHTVLIVGAGPTGLALAVELKRAGLPVRIVDKAEQPAPHSQALVLQARTLEQFERYRIADQALARGRKLLRGSLVSEGKTILSLEFDRIPGRYPFVLFLPQSDTERLLTEHLRSLGCEIERGTELLSFQNSKYGVVAGLRHKSGVKQSAPARWLIGCDGAHSVVRKGMQVSFEGDTVGLDFFLGDFELSGPDLPGDELRLYLHHGDVVFVGRLNDKLLRVIVALHPQAAARPVDRPLTLADFQAPMDRVGAHLTVKSSAWMTPFHINQRKATHYRADSAFLAGDASHVHSPVAGQGMNTGIQDAANLAWKLAAVADGAETELLDTYDEERGGVGEALLKITSRGLSAATSVNTIFERIRDLVAPALSNLPWVQNALAGFVSETAIDYRGSSIVADYGGDGTLRGGERVPNPDVEYARGERGRLLDALTDGRALALGIGLQDMLKIRARVPGANVLELRYADDVLGPEIEAPAEPSLGETPGDHPISAKFPAAGPASTAAGRAFMPAASVSRGGVPAMALLTPELAQLFGSENRIVVIRPDGYLGFRGSRDDLGRLDDYARLTGLT